MTALRRLLAGRGLAASLARALLGSSGLRLAGMGFGFLVGVQLARGLGVEGYGIYGMAMSIIAMLTIPTEFGVPQLLTREVAAAHARRDPDRVRSVIRWGRRAVLSASLVVAAPVLAWLVISGHGIASPLGMTMLVGLVMIPLVAIGNLQGASLRGLQHIVKGQFPEVLLRPALFSVLLFAFSFLGREITTPTAMALGTLAAAISCLASGALLRRELPPSVARPLDKSASAGWLRAAIPMALTEGMRVLQGHLVVIMLGLFSAAAVVGVFRVASSAAQLIAVAVTIFNVVAAPMVSRLHAQKDTARLQRLLVWVALGTTGCTLVLTAPLLFAGGWIIEWAFGAEYGPATLALKLLCLGAIVNAVFGVSGVVLNMTHNEQRVTRASVVALVTLIVTSPFLIRLWEAEGAALANVTSVVVWRVIMWIDCRQILGLETSILGIKSLRGQPVAVVADEGGA